MSPTEDSHKSPMGGHLDDGAPTSAPTGAATAGARALDPLENEMVQRAVGGILVLPLRLLRAALGGLAQMSAGEPPGGAGD